MGVVDRKIRSSRSSLPTKPVWAKESLSQKARNGDYSRLTSQKKPRRNSPKYPEPFTRRQSGNRLEREDANQRISIEILQNKNTDEREKRQETHF